MPPFAFQPVDTGRYTAAAYGQLAQTAQSIGTIASQAYSDYSRIQDIKQKKQTLINATQETFGVDPNYAKMFTEENKAKWMAMDPKELEAAIANFSAAALYQQETQARLEQDNPQLAASISWQLPHINRMFKADKNIEVNKARIGELQKTAMGVRAQEFLAGEGGKLTTAPGIRGLATEAQLPIEEAIKYEKAFRKPPRVSTVIHKKAGPKPGEGRAPVLRGEIGDKDILDKIDSSRKAIARYESLKNRSKQTSLLEVEQAELNRLEDRVVAGKLKEGIKLFEVALKILYSDLDPKTGKPKMTAYQALGMAQDKLDYGQNLMNKVYSTLLGEPGAEPTPSPEAPFTFMQTPVDTSRVTPDVQGQLMKPGDEVGPVTVEGEEEEIMQFFE